MNDTIIAGKVLTGSGMGKETGLKTANLDIELIRDKQIKKGLYNCSVTHDKTQYRGLLYYGYNSLSKKDCLEIHILNFDQEIYDQEIEIKINEYLRAPKKFDSIEKLSKQLKGDLKKY